MDHAHHPGSLNRTAWSATLHCLTGCAIGEVLGMVLGTALGWGNLETIALAVVLAFFFGYLLTMRPLLVAGMELRRAAKLALAADTASITVMEIEPRHLEPGPSPHVIIRSMQRILKTLVILALVSLTPFRAVAAVTVGFCASGHGDTSVAVHAQSGHGTGAHAHRATDAPAQPIESSCNICAEHCSSAAFAIPAAPAVDAWVSGQDRTVLAEHRSALHVPDQLDRPPLA